MTLNPDLIIRELYATKLAGEIAEMLGWTKTMVYKRATKLGLRKARPTTYASNFEAHVAKAVVHAAQVPHAMSKTDAGRCGGLAAMEARAGWPRVTTRAADVLGPLAFAY